MQQFGTQDEQNETENDTNAFALEGAFHNPLIGLAARGRGYGGGEYEHPIDFDHGGVTQKTGQGGKSHDEGRGCGNGFGGCLEPIDEERHDVHAADPDQAVHQTDTSADTDTGNDLLGRCYIRAINFIGWRHDHTHSRHSQHDGHDDQKRGFDQKVIVIGHQAMGMHLDRLALHCLPQIF